MSHHASSEVFFCNLMCILDTNPSLSLCQGDIHLWDTTKKSFLVHVTVFFIWEDTVGNRNKCQFLTWFTHNLPVSVCTHVHMNKMWSHFLLCSLLLHWFLSPVRAWHLLASAQNNSSWGGSYFALLYLSSTWSLSLGSYIGAWHVQSTYNVWRRVRGAGWSNSEI